MFARLFSLPDTPSPLASWELAVVAAALLVWYLLCGFVMRESICRAAFAGMSKSHIRKIKKEQTRSQRITLQYILRYGSGANIKAKITLYYIFSGLTLAYIALTVARQFIPSLWIVTYPIGIVWMLWSGAAIIVNALKKH